MSKFNKFMIFIFFTLAILEICLVIYLFGMTKPDKIIDSYEIITIDGCEYIDGNTLVHKGNCTNHVIKL